MVSVIMGVIVGLTFLFGFGNVLNLALPLGVSAWVAPLVAPAVDLSVLALLLGTRYLAIRGAGTSVMRPARRLLLFSGGVTLALNVADPILAGEWGRAAFDAVGPLLLIGWADVGPGLLQAIGPAGCGAPNRDSEREDRSGSSGVGPREIPERKSARLQDELLERAMLADAEHRAVQQRPISAETLRKEFKIGAGRSRGLVSQIRQTYAESNMPHR